MDILGQKVLYPMDLNRGATIIDLFGRAADKLLIDFASVIIQQQQQQQQLYLAKYNS